MVWTQLDDALDHVYMSCSCSASYCAEGESANMAPTQKTENQMESAQEADQSDGLGLVETTSMDQDEVCSFSLLLIYT